MKKGAAVTAPFAADDSFFRLFVFLIVFVSDLSRGFFLRFFCSPLFINILGGGQDIPGVFLESSLIPTEPNNTPPIKQASFE